MFLGGLDGFANENLIFLRHPARLSLSAETTNNCRSIFCNLLILMVRVFNSPTHTITKIRLFSFVGASTVSFPCYPGTEYNNDAAEVAHDVASNCPIVGFVTRCT